MRRKPSKILVVLILILGISMTQGIPTTVVKVSAKPSVPYNLGNWTYISKPVHPIIINPSNDSQIPLGAYWNVSIPRGENWTFVYNLRADSSYHVYLYGDWEDYDPLTNKTDYDIFVYDPQGTLASIHTESAGLPEHLGTPEEPFFIPKNSGQYSFFVKNDLKESRGNKTATFMLIEHLECNRWYQKYLAGKVNEEPVEDTSWAYELITSSERVEVWVEVPDSLDMYEAQLYLMASPSRGMGTLLKGIPLPWEPGLYGEMDSSTLYGGYGLDREGFRHANASASCEYPGQDMFINYAFPHPEEDSGNYTSRAGEDIFLYHLGLIAENGTGFVRFMFKTDFEAPSLSIQNPIDTTSSENETAVTAHVYDEGSSLDRVLLNYTRNDWETWYSFEMSPSQNHTYVSTIPRQPAGSTIKYKITASDIAGNIAEEESRYVVKDSTNMTFSLSKSVLYGGESIKVTGSISRGEVPVILDYACQDLRISTLVPASYVGTFADEYTPEKTGDWTVSASWPGDEKSFGVFGGCKSFTVRKASTLITCNVDVEAITIGGDVTVTGSIEPPLENMGVSLEFTKPDGTTIERRDYTSSDGSFSLVFEPDFVGSWRVQGYLVGDDFHHSQYSDPVSFFVNDTWLNQYRFYIIASGGIVTVAICGAFLFFRRQEEWEEELGEEIEGEELDEEAAGEESDEETEGQIGRETEREAEGEEEEGESHEESEREPAGEELDEETEQE